MKAEPLILLFGEESFLIERELKAIEAECGLLGAEDLNRTIREAADTKAADILNMARTMPFMGTRRLVVLKDAHAWKAEEWEKFIPYAERPNPSTCLVFIAATVDKRRNWFKTFQKTARIVECEHPADAKLPEWIGKMAGEAGIKLDPGVAQALTLRVGPDLQLLWREILKLQAFAGEDRRVRVEDVENLVAESRGTTVFVLGDALGARDLGKALKALSRLAEMGEPAPLLLVMIVRHFRILWRAREILDEGGKTDNSAAARIGVPPFFIRKTLDQAKKWSQSALETAFKRFIDADINLKSGGGFEVLDKLAVDLCESGSGKKRTC